MNSSSEPMRPRPHQVVVLGNGRSVFRNRLGPTIDACDVVVRCNNGFTGGFEEYVGTRTDILVFCDTRIDESYVIENALNGPTLVMYLVSRDVSEIDARLRSRCEFVSGHGARAIAAQFGLTKRLTTGFVAAYYCLNRFPDSDIYLHGFDYVNRQQERSLTHYWNNKGTDQLHTVHSITQEAKLVRRWVKCGYLSVLKDRVGKNNQFAQSITDPPDTHATGDNSSGLGDPPDGSPLTYVNRHTR